MTWREYHEATKHTVESVRRARQGLDWANMPNPYRYYEGVPVLDLPADTMDPGMPVLDVLQGMAGGTVGGTAAADGPGFLSQLLFYSAAISASKVVPSTGYRYALRVNPSSGNLHPTEFHFRTRGLKGWPDGFYHYDPSRHMAEQRATGDPAAELGNGSIPIVFVLTSIAWREAWKYGDRAYRYCLHDVGHAWQALGLAARALGCECYAAGGFPDDEIARLCRLNPDEWPMLILRLSGNSIPLGEPHSAETSWLGGEANRLSNAVIAYPSIDEIHSTTKSDKSEHGIACAYDSAVQRSGPGSTGIKLLSPGMSSRPFGETVRARRSALDFLGGMQSMSFAQLSAILAISAQPLSADFAGLRFIQLYLYVHRVAGLEPGVYKFWPGHGELQQIQRGDQRMVAAGLSLGQELAGNACVAFSMIGDFDGAALLHGDRGYRYVHFAAGAIGHRLYLAAAAMGLGATGIGAFYDDEVHRYLKLAPEQGQVVYHFAIGYPVPDPRVSAGPC